MNIHPCPDREMQLKKLALQVTQLHMSRTLPYFTGNLDVSVEKLFSAAGEDMVLRLHVYFYGAQDTVKVPASWWDHFKEAKFPKWALKKWPVKYRTIEVMALFPDLPFDGKMPRKVISYIPR